MLVNIPKNSKVKCQKDGCNNFVRLFFDYNGRIEEFTCAICLGFEYMPPDKSPILANNYTTCVTCNSQFKVMQTYQGTRAECLICRSPRTVSNSNVTTVQTNNYSGNSNQVKPVYNRFRMVRMCTPDFYSPSNIYDWTDFNYPIKCCKEKKGYWFVSNKGRGNDPRLDDLLNMDGCSDTYFHQKGENGGNAWIFIIRRNDTYVYFNASCNNKGFDCEGGGIVYYANDWNVFWNYCLQAIPGYKWQRILEVYDIDADM